MIAYRKLQGIKNQSPAFAQIDVKIPSSFEPDQSLSTPSKSGQALLLESMPKTGKLPEKDPEEPPEPEKELPKEDPPEKGVPKPELPEEQPPAPDKDKPEIPFPPPDRTKAASGRSAEHQ